MNRHKITLSYDGTAYSGWQIQPNGVTVQEKLQEAIHRITGETRKLHGSGRTDRGVHARRQVAHFDLRRQWPMVRLRTALNAVLPPDIRVLRVEKADSSFHARRHTLSKEYRYFIYNGDVMPPFERAYRTHVPGKLDVAAMRKAASYLEGRHDFAAFAANPNQFAADTVRRLEKLRIDKRGAQMVVIARGDGFLYKMVRSLSGFLLQVGDGTIPPFEARAILSSKRRTSRVRTAPPQGLFLWEVTY